MIKFVRDSKIVWPYCSDCGCRLRLSSVGLQDNYYKIEHFYGFFGKDARGCNCKLSGYIVHRYDPSLEAFV